MGRRVVAALAIAVLAISFAGPLFRLAAPTPPLVASGLRLLLAATCLLPFSLRAHRQGRLPATHLRWGVVAGGLYGLHFGAWVWSLKLTSVAASVTLVTATPLLLAIIGVATGRDRPTGRLWLAIGLATAGVGVIGGAHLELAGDALVGDALALLGAAAMAGYLLVVRRLGRVDPLGFTGIAAAVGGVTLLGTALVLGHAPVAASPAAWGWLALAAAIPQLVGHSLLTWSLRHTTPTVVGLATVGEPVGASLIAWLVLGEAVTGEVAAGSAIILVAVVTALWRPRPALLVEEDG
ncbi:MAG: DMT family transporter [Myxococcales bacterium]|nr:DMT family transporter [Myxococcales bacterium]